MGSTAPLDDPARATILAEPMRRAGSLIPRMLRDMRYPSECRYGLFEWLVGLCSDVGLLAAECEAGAPRRLSPPRRHRRRRNARSSARPSAIDGRVALTPAAIVLGTPGNFRATAEAVRTPRSPTAHRYRRFAGR